MKLKFGFPIDPKNFNPLSVSINGKKIIEADNALKSVNPMELLETLASTNVRGAGEGSTEEKIRVLKTVYNKVNPL